MTNKPMNNAPRPRVPWQKIAAILFELTGGNPIEINLVAMNRLTATFDGHYFLVDEALNDHGEEVLRIERITLFEAKRRRLV